MPFSPSALRQNLKSHYEELRAKAATQLRLASYKCAIKLLTRAAEQRQTCQWLRLLRQWQQKQQHNSLQLQSTELATVSKVCAVQQLAAVLNSWIRARAAAVLSCWENNLNQDGLVLLQGEIMEVLVHKVKQSRRQSGVQLLGSILWRWSLCHAHSALRVLHRSSRPSPNPNLNPEQCRIFDLEQMISDLELKSEKQHKQATRDIKAANKEKTQAVMHFAAEKDAELDEMNVANAQAEEEVKRQKKKLKKVKKELESSQIDLAAANKQASQGMMLVAEEKDAELEAAIAFERRLAMSRWSASLCCIVACLDTFSIRRSLNAWQLQALGSTNDEQILKQKQKQKKKLKKIAKELDSTQANLAAAELHQTQSSMQFIEVLEREKRTSGLRVLAHILKRWTYLNARNELRALFVRFRTDQSKT